MPRYSDAALLKGEYAHMAAELRAGERNAPTPADWNATSCENAAEETAQSVAKQLFELQATLKGEEEQLEIAAMTAAGIMIVLGLFPGEGDLIRLEGHLLNSNQPVAQLIHAHQLALTISKRNIADAAPEEDAMRIGFVIFDHLAKRANSKTKGIASKAPARKRTSKAKAAKTSATKTKAPKR